VSAFGQELLQAPGASGIESGRVMPTVSKP
jgi:hypothetical protein